MNVVISDPKTKKTYNINVEKPVFLGRKLGEEVDLGGINLEGYKAVITGGSDKDGFPMKPSLQGTGRKKVLLSSGIGYRPKEKGIRRRKRVRGNTIAEDIHQVNLKVTKYGKEPLDKLLKEEKGEENKDNEANKE